MIVDAIKIAARESLPGPAQYQRLISIQDVIPLGKITRQRVLYGVIDVKGDSAQGVNNLLKSFQVNLGVVVDFETRYVLHGLDRTLRTLEGVRRIYLLGSIAGDGDFGVAGYRYQDSLLALDVYGSEDHDIGARIAFLSGDASLVGSDEEYIQRL